MANTYGTLRDRRVHGCLVGFERETSWLEQETSGLELAPSSFTLQHPSSK
ncbi:MAG: hypothetical protein NHB32_10250 [Fischerella sp. CENA71]|nr:hypothetical protein [Fischerella sp. CENA71]